MSKTVLITGAAGNLGGKLRAHFASLGWTLRLMDVAAGPDIVAGDISVWDEGWTGLFAGVDAVVHLAGRPSPDTGWDDIVRYNINGTQNVFEAAVRGGARRLIFASSNWVMAGHRFGAGPVTPEMEPFPVNAYGVSKLIGERLGRSYHERWGLSVICFRIGWTQHGENRPGPHMTWGSWGQAMWLSDRDFCHAHERAVLAEGVGFAVLNLMSDNPGMRWDLEPTRHIIGYAPQDGAAPVMTPERADGEVAARDVFEATGRLRDLSATRRW